MTAKLDSKTIEAAGGIVERDTPKGLLIAVIYRERYGGEWGLPKGKRQAGESWQETALREIKEETGLNPVIIGMAGASTYLADGVPKLVLYWRMRVGRDTPPFTPNAEVTNIEWLTPANAVKRLSHREEADLVRSTFPADWRASVKHFVTSPGEPTASILRLRRSKRLSSAIAAYDQELQGRATSGGRLSDGLMMIQNSIESASSALQEGNLEQGWKLFQTAQRLELLYLDTAELNAAAVAMRHEADKLNPWRKSAVIELLNVKLAKEATRERIFRAALLRDEHYNNEAYKDGLRRGTALRLAAALVAAIIALLWLSYVGFLADTLSNSAVASGNSLFRILLSVAMVGLLGATISAITDMPKPQGSARIPEMASTIQVTLLRLLMGPATAIVLYFVIKSNLYSAIFNLVQPDGYGILVIAFIAGFSERLVLRVVETIAGKPS